MGEISEHRRSLNLKSSDHSIDSTPTVVSPGSPVHHRPGYHRITSLNEVDTSYKRAEGDSSDRDAQLESSSSFGIAGNSFRSSQERGLGIVETRRPVAVGSMDIPRTPLLGDPLLSPSSTRVGRNSPHVERHFENEEIHYGDQGRNGSNSAVFEPFTASSSHERLYRNTLSATETHVEPFESGYRAGQRSRRCQMDWLSTTILVLAVYSTVGSGLWLAVALIRPRWGRTVTPTGKVPPATASLLCAALAKSIELSFVTVFVCFLGQVLSRKAVNNQSRGITIAEMSMRAWVMQPGTMITHWRTVRYAAFTFLGALSLFAALMSTLYTTASDALVAPKLRFGGAESRHIYGRVATKFANPDYITSRCNTLIDETADPDYNEKTCIQIQHAGQSFQDSEQYVIQWTNNINSGNESAILGERPRPIEMLYYNTTVQGSWIHAQNITELSKNFPNRIINNVSMAMPHAGVFAAARDPLNDIIQPQDLSGLGEYVIRASVPSPVVNILCASVSENELDPLVKTSWPNSTLNVTQWPDFHDLPDWKTWLDQNETALDDIFEWGGKYGRQRPMFAKYPKAYNTIVNSSRLYSDSIYLLATTATGQSTLCSIRGSLTPDCSTEYHASLSGGTLTTNCEDPKDDLSYHKSDPKATNGILDKDWINVAISWITSISLNAGITDGSASNARLVTQLILDSPALNPSLPSIAEYLTVLSGRTLLRSTLDAPFIHFWNYSTTVPTLNDPQYQAFNATLNFQDYASGATQRWQNLFHVVLIVIFVTNVVCLAYLILSRGLVTDFIEPENLFSLSLNSPPSKNLSGSPKKEQLATNWIIKQSEQDQLYIHAGETQPVRRKEQGPLDYEMQSPMKILYSRFASTRTSVF